ncbi:MAG: hypothetical protein MJ248_03155 [Bacilli bacterium]|nr:hypothetical protein [Bacilli bacterium]
MKINKLLLLSVALFPLISGCNEDEKSEETNTCQTYQTCQTCQQCEECAECPECPEFDEDSLFKVDEETFTKAKSFTGIEYAQINFSVYEIFTEWSSSQINRVSYEYAPNVMKKTDMDGEEIRYYKENGNTYLEEIDSGVVTTSIVPDSYMTQLNEIAVIPFVDYDQIKDNYDESGKSYIFKNTQSGRTFDNLPRFYKGRIVEYYAECFVTDNILIVKEVTITYNETTPTPVTLPE